MHTGAAGLHTYTHTHTHRFIHTCRHTSRAFGPLPSKKVSAVAACTWPAGLLHRYAGDMTPPAMAARQSPKSVPVLLSIYYAGIYPKLDQESM